MERAKIFAPVLSGPRTGPGHHSARAGDFEAHSGSPRCRDQEMEMSILSEIVGERQRDHIHEVISRRYVRIAPIELVIQAAGEFLCEWAREADLGAIAIESFGAGPRVSSMIVIQREAGRE